ncbi:ATP-binding protein [Nocardiopsis sp. NPDC055551]
MRFGVLGPLIVRTDDGASVDVPERKVRVLLGALLLARGRLVPVDTLVDHLWGFGDAPLRPDRALQRKVWALRSALSAAEPDAGERVRFRSAGYLLHTAEEAVDAERFQVLVARARAAEDPGSRAGLFARALELWRGPALADLADETFTEPARARLEQEWLTATEEYALARLDLGEHRQVVRDLSEPLAENPLRERLVAARMRALNEDGRRAESLRLFADLARGLREELGVDPGPEVTDLHTRILRQESGGGGIPRRRLPRPLTEMLGREDDLSRIRSLLAHERLVTLTGFGGVGKTRLATALAHELDGDTHMVEYAAHARGADPAEVLARTLGLRDEGEGGTRERLVRGLTGQDTLLVLDNCEHLLEPIGDLAAHLLARLPDLRVLATSREPLGVPGEHLHPVGPLPVPPSVSDPAEAHEYAAVRLFVARARAAGPGFELTETNAPDVARLTRRLDGIPLALELAATRIRALGVHGVLCRLDDRFRLLATAQRHLPPRQRTLRAMIDWSWDLLDERERVLLRRLSVFTGGWHPEDAEAVCADPDHDVLDPLTRLVDRSLVAATVDPCTGEIRHHLLESIADYARARLAEAGETRALRDRHARHFSHLAEEQHATLFGPDQGRGIRRLDAEAANLYAAVDHAVAVGEAKTALETAGGLTWSWYLRGRYREGLRVLTLARVVDGADAHPGLHATVEATTTVFEILNDIGHDHAQRARAALESGPETPLIRARLALMLGLALQSRGDQDVSEELVGLAPATFREHGDDWGLGAALVAQASHTLGRGDLARAERQGREALDLFERLGDSWGGMNARGVLAVLAEIRGEYGRSRRLHEAALADAEELDLTVEVAGSLSGLGRLALLEGDLDRADALHRRSADLVRGQGGIAERQHAQMGLALSARRRGRLDEAEAYLTELVDWSRRVRWWPGTALTLCELGFVAELRGDADEALRLHTEGLVTARGTDDTRAIALALEGIAGAYTLTGRLEESARLLGVATRARESSGAPMPAAERGDVDRVETLLRADLDEVAFEKALREGRGSALPQVVAELIGDAGR